MTETTTTTEEGTEIKTDCFGDRDNDKGRLLIWTDADEAAWDF